MSERPVFHAAIGLELAAARDRLGWSQRQAIDMARRRGIDLGLGSLRFLELGKTKHPDAELLKAVSKLYKLSFEELARRFIEANYGIRFDPVRHEGDQQSGLRDGGSLPYDAAAIGVELDQLRERVAQYDKEVRKMRSLADDVFQAAIALEEIRTTTKGTTARRRHDRKTG